MKNIFLVLMLFSLTSTMVVAQNAKFGLTAGFLNVSGKIEVEDIEPLKRDKSGGYAGIVLDITLTEKFHIQPELLYSRNTDNGLLMIPIMAKIYPIDGFNIQIGPQIDYSTDPYPIEGPLKTAQDLGFEINDDDFTRLGISLAAGLGYDINDKFFLESRYTFQVNDVYTGDLNISIKGHIFNFGLGYRF